MTREELVFALEDASGEELLFAQACEMRDRTIGNCIYLRGLIELSNYCSKDCFYCGIRGSNLRVKRYELSDEEVLEVAQKTWRGGYGSLVIQAGERTDERFVARIESLIRQIKSLSNGDLGITLSLGEQSAETYRRWRGAGAHRYLLRIETSSPELYARIHPRSSSFAARLAALEALRAADYHVGTGVMVGLPGQTLEQLADDLLFFKELDIDMCGMGPYIEHPDTPLVVMGSTWLPEERFRLTLRMIALLRLLLPEINIASTTALHALHPHGRELGMAAGANVLMPNLTPSTGRGHYLLYENKPLMDIDLTPFLGQVAWGELGDSAHFRARKSK